MYAWPGRSLAPRNCGLAPGSALHSAEQQRTTGSARQASVPSGTTCCSSRKEASFVPGQARGRFCSLSIEHRAPPVGDGLPRCIGPVTAVEGTFRRCGPAGVPPPVPWWEGPPKDRVCTARCCVGGSAVAPYLCVSSCSSYVRVGWNMSDMGPRCASTGGFFVDGLRGHYLACS